MTNRVLKGLVILAFSAFVYFAAAMPFLQPLLQLPGGPRSVIEMSILVVLFTVGHAVYALGWRHGMAFFGISFSISWFLEQAGVATGAIYGGYHYTDLLGARLGQVPLLIPLSWFEYLYCSYIAVNYILLDRPVGTRVSAGSIGAMSWLLVLSLATATFTTAQDLVIDPIMSGKVFPAWVWETPGGYYGVPALNFVGWFVTAFLGVFIYRLVELWRSPQPQEHPSRAMMTLPVLLYGANMLVSMTPFAPPGLKVIGPFVIGPPVLLALSRIWLPKPRTGPFDES